ncbi:N-acetyltransferase family protein [Salipiger sp. P9]|uniref:GNAT family N-acetyltransferase n=1 Tax=Salipiger pentaromativorans TaxID=2943193 RepID=UPI002157FA99|nr:GNAT family N-acetyltransferase [Salipiger pentaromativorans]MCR8549645.1 N-acetyltransferase family protein [Salipiger pentaromativorans]
MDILDATEADLPGILAIYNDAVLTTAAIWNETPVDLGNRHAWWRDRIAQGYPVLVARDGGEVLAYASFGNWRDWEGYRHTVEHSIYVRAESRGRGIASLLLPALVERARDLGKHVMVAGIESGNAASIRLHRRHGFEVTGEMREVGAKFGRWLDLTFLQRRLDARPAPDARP